MRNCIKRIIALVTILLLLSNCCGCFWQNAASQNPTTPVTWLDADGSIIDTQVVTKDYDPLSRPLPEDSNDWHYTGWSCTQSGNIIVCSAIRVAKHHIIWKDHDGTILSETYFTETDDFPELALPLSTEKWQYTQWNQTSSGNEYIYIAERQPQFSYFAGNVFQIILKDEYSQIIGSGSGFVINEEGWFITNNHVMEDSHSAIAFFDIRDDENGQQYTQLDILGGVYKNEKTDIFIGKISGYEKLKQHYNPIPFTSEYAEGNSSFSVGYPNASTKLQINTGVILEEYSDIYNKVDGIYYVLSDSYIAPGSSGGILVDENLAVIGITSIGFYADTNKEHYISGGSIPYFIFKNALTQLSDDNIIPLFNLYIS